MSAERDVNRIVRSWLREDGHEDASRVLADVLEYVDTTPRRRSRWPARRFPDMNRLTVIATMAAAVLVVAVIGYTMLPSSGPGGPTAVPSATAPTSSPPRSPTPAPIATFPVRGLPGEGPLDPDRYAWRWQEGFVTFDVPAGWFVTDLGLGVGKLTEQPGEAMWTQWLPGSGTTVTHVYADACASAGTLSPIGPTVADLVRALDDQATTTTTIAEVTIDGYAGTRVDLTVPDPPAESECRFPGWYQIWADEAETVFFAFPRGTSGFVIAVDVEGTRAVFTASIGPEASPTDVDELEAMIASIAFE